MGFVRRYSQASSSSSSQQVTTTTPLEYFSLVVKGKKDNPEILTEELRKLVESKTQVGRWKRPWISGPGGSRSALVLLASKDMAKCLESRDFMSTFLEALGPPGEPQGSATVDVLTGLTDGLQPETLGARPRSGLSVLYGPQSILPRLWEQEEDTTASAGAPTTTDRAASVSVAPAYPGQPFHSHVTIPMANTIFQNGRRSTLFATRYERAAQGGRFEATLTLDKAAQAIEVTTEAGPRFAPRLPLVPLAPPREIAAGLGNIVRQVVDAGGKPAPASRELEDLIPRLLEARGRRDTVGVWAVVVPPHVIREHDAFKNIRPFSECLDGSVSEKELVKLNWECLGQVGTHGLRVHKILSGGGGWGAKQGLLSLDPETSYDAPEQEDIDDFIKAFEARFRSKDESAAAVEVSAGEEDSSAVAPGSYLLFCAQAELGSGDLDVEIGGEGGRGWNFGVAERHDGEVGRTAAEGEGEGQGVTALPEVFTAMSAEGVYLRLGAPGQAKEHAAIRFFPFTTKIDVPHAFLCH